MKYYISKNDVFASIDYFKKCNLDSDDMLFLFLLAKHLGITTSFPVTFMVGKLSSEAKDDILNSLWMLGGLFDSSEVCGRKGLMFPTGFSKLSLYQPGTDFQGSVGRIKDTIEKKNHNVPLYNDNESLLTLKSNYKDLLNDNYLYGNKISLSHLAAWLFRFTSIDFESVPDSKQFSRTVETMVEKYFKISKSDFLWLFDDDFSSTIFTPSTTPVTGREVRSRFDFSDDKIPEIRSVTDFESSQTNFIDAATTNKILHQCNGNPTDEDIFNVLLNKKQIVITGVPGVGKSYYVQNLSQNSFFKKVKTIQFHSDFTYQDFIGSETLIGDGGATHIATRVGVFLDFVLDAVINPNDNYLFVIDELNRGDIAGIFGETILTLDRGYHVQLSRPFGNITDFYLPDNLYIVGTMNTSDRNIAFLDLAIRRRFAFISLSPNYDFLSDSVVFRGYDLGNILKIINQRILDTLRDSELILGQSYFIPPLKDGRYIWDDISFKNQFNFVLLPTLSEYSFNDSSAVSSIVGDRLCDSIQDLDDFLNAFDDEFRDVK